VPIVMSKREDVICSIMLTVVIACSVMNNLIWLWIDTRPPKWDEAYYLTLSLKYHESLFSGGVGAFVRSLLTLDPARPPLVPALAVPAYILLGKSPDSSLCLECSSLISSMQHSLPPPCTCWCGRRLSLGVGHPWPSERRWALGFCAAPFFQFS